ncbi:MAG: carboxypeptidase regulatory-like domain-containing protein [Bacteroidetes bacterium]|nr:carboxypeptidase regulatory-like domain-containing protein [Bacteroidota bacterium]
MTIITSFFRKISMLLALFIIFISVGFCYFYFENGKNNPVFSSDTKPDPRFISIKNNQFILDGKPWYLKAVNFVTTLRKNDKEFWPSVFIGYIPEQEYYQTNKDSCLSELFHTFVLIHDLGYNSVRITGIGEYEIQNKHTGKVAFRADYFSTKDFRFQMDGDSVLNLYFSAIEDVLSCAQKAGLKVIFTLKVFPEAPITEWFLGKVAARFKDDPTILAYDFFNEPLYFDDKQRNKESIYTITRRWNNIVKKNSPHQLTTIGLACQREVFEWDPNLVNVDFVSFHPYEYEKDQVRNEMYWYSKFVNKPWIIGETGIPSNNDSIPYSDQAAFTKKTIEQNAKCGGMGYSWWQYKDVDWGDYHQNYLGIVSRNGFTKNSLGRMIHGTPKPMNDVIKDFDPFQSKGKCFCPENYYNFSSNTYFKIIGRVVDESGNPIEGAGVLAWDEWWINHYFSTTKPDGTFEIYSDYDFYHWMISPSNYEMIRADVNLKNVKLVSGTRTIDLGTLKIKKIDLNSWRLNL